MDYTKPNIQNMKYFTTIIFTLVLSLQASFLSAKIDVVKFKTLVYKNNEPLFGALAFVYMEDSLVGTFYSNAKGEIKLELLRGIDYTLSVSKPGHVTNKIKLSTKYLFKDEVKKVTLPIRLYNLHDKDIDLQMVKYTIKWNPILEKFESFGLNFGWIKEIEELEKQKLLEAAEKIKLFS